MLKLLKQWLGDTHLYKVAAFWYDIKLSVIKLSLVVLQVIGVVIDPAPGAWFIKNASH